VTVELRPLLAEALEHAGFTLHDCDNVAGRKHLGGVCITPLTGGVYPHLPNAGAEACAVAWTQHDAMYLPGDEPRAASPHAHACQLVQDEMNIALAVILDALGFEVTSFGPSSKDPFEGGASVVVGYQPPTHAGG
jgi:hypothetical protein